MDNQAGSLTEKKLAYYETLYKENVLSKPLNVNVSVTESGISGFGYICDQIGTKEDEPLYSRYNCGFDEITMRKMRLIKGKNWKKIITLLL